MSRSKRKVDDDLEDDNDDDDDDLSLDEDNGATYDEFF